MLTVTTSQDSVPGSLRDVIARANQLPSATVSIAPSVGTKIVLTDGEIIISTNLKLINRTGHHLSIYPIGDQRIFHIVASSQLVEITSSNHSIFLLDGQGDRGGAILVDPDDHYLILKNMNLRNNRAISGGAIYTNGKVVLNNVSVNCNEAQFQGGGVWSKAGILLKKSRVTLNRVISTQEGNGGGGLFVAQGNLIVQKSRITENQAFNGSGGGIIVMIGDITLSDSEVTLNWAADSAGIQEGQGDIKIYQSSITQNQSNGSVGGGGITIILGNVELIKCQVSYNRTQGMFSGGIVSLVGNVSLITTRILGNTNRGPGGGVALNVGSLDLTESQVCENVGASLGGGVVNFAPGHFIRAKKSQIIGNILTDAQTIAETIAHFLESVQAYLNRVSAQAQKAGVDPQFISQVSSELSQVWTQIAQLQISGKVGGGALAVLLDTKVILDQVKVVGNFSEDLGGGLFNHKGVLRLRRSQVLGNRALGQGGGIHNSGELSLEQVKIRANTALDGGGVFTRTPFQRCDSDIENNIPNNVVVVK